MAVKAKKENKFNVGDTIVRTMGKVVIEAEIDYISYTDKKYIFKNKITMSMSQISSMGFDRVHEVFTLKQ